ncbi:LIM zinc-binding domain-containing Nebulette, partial [Podiceps cristatus]
KTKYTSILDTPDFLRAKQGQKIQSQVEYKKDYEKKKDKYTTVVDTPEHLRTTKVNKQISDVKYHEDFEKSKGSFTPVVTDPITERVKKNMQDFSDISYRGIQRRVVEMERKRVDQDQENLTVGYKHAKTIELPQQRSSSVATQQTTVSSVPSHPSTAGKTYRAMYDYMAADADEVSFKDGDTIVNVQAIDEGWMYGTVQRTGKTGMLPANYVEAV